jgi:hypothetical protein
MRPSSAALIGAIAGVLLVIAVRLFYDFYVLDRSALSFWDVWDDFHFQARGLLLPATVVGLAGAAIGCASWGTLTKRRVPLAFRVLSWSVLGGGAGFLLGVGAFFGFSVLVPSRGSSDGTGGIGEFFRLMGMAGSAMLIGVGIGAIVGAVSGSRRRQRAEPDGRCPGDLHRQDTLAKFKEAKIEDPAAHFKGQDGAGEGEGHALPRPARDQG